MEEKKIKFLTNNILRAEHVAVVPIERMEWMRPQTESYAVVSFKRGNRIVKKSLSLVGLILKNRKTCVFAPEAPRLLTVETIKMINHFVVQINNRSIWYDSKNDEWRGVCAPKEDKE